jgi:thiamine pyrophosphate-dependent acetolactate synthase large subunit-like protein
MNALSACEVIARARGDAVLVATMGAMLAFDQLKADEGRISSVPLMGGAAPLGLGIALAQPKCKVVVVDGDASLLMQLGALVVVGGQQPRNFYHFVINNGVQFAGMFNLPLPAKGRVDFPGMARSAGYADAMTFSELGSFSKAIDSMLAAPGPIFIELRVVAEPSTYATSSPQKEVPDRQFTRMAEEATRLSAFLQRHA